MELPKSKYKYVYAEFHNGKHIYWQGNVRDSERGASRRKTFKSERDAALWVDKTLLQLGKEPVNILKKKQ